MASSTALTTEQLSELRRQVRSGPWEPTLTRLTAALQRDPRSPNLEGLLREMAGASRKAAERSREIALSQGATMALPSFGNGESKRLEALRLSRVNQQESTIRAFRRSEGLYNEAARAAATARASAVPSNPATTVDPPPVPRPESIAPGKPAAPLPDPVVSGPPVTPAATTPLSESSTPATPPNITDDDLVRKTLNDYAGAMSARDVSAVGKVLRLDDRARRTLQNDFSSSKSSRYQIVVNAPVQIVGASAIVRATLITEIDVKGRGRKTETDAVIVRLQKNGASWMITSVGR